MSVALVVNCGSSTVKYSLLDPAPDASGPQVHAKGTVEVADGDFEAALDEALAAALDQAGDVSAADVAVVGHRVVHGGDRFSGPVLVDDDVLAVIDDLAALAPLHNPVNAAGIRAARRRLPHVPHVAVFDTAFHTTIPAHASTYAVPAVWRREHGVRRYGFHGTSHAYVSRATAAFLGRPLAEVNTVVLHLGNGASACAVKGGRSIDTSMGLTPLAGLVMGTRSGDVDPGVAALLAREAGLSAQQVDDELNHAGGLLALAGVSDMRTVTERAAAGDPDAELALAVYCYRIRSYVGAYVAALGRLDAIAFTAGVGENSAVVRARSLAGLERLGVRVDDERNRAAGPALRLISPDPEHRPDGDHGPDHDLGPDGRDVAVLVVPTDEEREIATQALALVG